MLSPLTEHSLGQVPTLLPNLVLTFWWQTYQCHPVKSSRTAGRSHLNHSIPSGVVVTRINSAPGPETAFFHTAEMSLSVPLQGREATCVSLKSCGLRFHLEPSLGVLTPQDPRAREIGLTPQVEKPRQMGLHSSGGLRHTSWAHRPDVLRTRQVGQSSKFWVQILPLPYASV